MAVTILLSVSARPGQGDALVKAFQDILPDTRTYEGCQGVTLHQRADDADSVLLVERWASVEAHDAYSVWRRDSGTLGSIMELAGGRPGTQVFTDAD